MRSAFTAGLLFAAVGFGQPALRITSPAAGAVVEAGKPLTVVLEATPPDALQMVLA